MYRTIALLFVLFVLEMNCKCINVWNTYSMGPVNKRFDEWIEWIMDLMYIWIYGWMNYGL